ncbi:ABCAD protein, partial [Nothocercus nigrocapillus]|nr:ABCAD protein [Nothocercus nigrocapillus]
LNRVVALVQNLEHTDLEFLIGQFKQVQQSLDHLFKSIRTLYDENLALGMLPDWLDTFENNLCNWNLTGFRQLSQLLRQDKLIDTTEMFALLLDVISLTEGLAHGNMTEALTNVYTFILTQEAKIPMLTEELSNQVESILMLQQTLSAMSHEPAEAFICISAVFCWTLTTSAPQNDPAFKTCDFAHSNFSLAYNEVVNIIKQLKLIPLEDSSSCTKEDFQTDIMRNLTCFFHEIREWNSLLLKFSELRHLNGSVLKELLDFWNPPSISSVPLEANTADSVMCSPTLKMQAALQLAEALDGMTMTEMETATAVLEQLDDLYDILNLSGGRKMSLIKTVLSNFQNTSNELSRLLGTEPVLSFFSLVQPLIALSSFGNRTYSVLMALSALNKNENTSNFEDFWFHVEPSIENLLVNFNVRHLLTVIEQGFQILRVATGQSVDLDVPIPQLNMSSVDAILRNFEDIEESVSTFLCECNAQNYSEILHILIFLMANEKSADDLLLVVKDIIDFLELFQNQSKEDYIYVFYDDLNSENMNNTHIADSVLQNSLLHMIADLAIIETALHSNNTELHRVDFFDLFFGNTQHGNYGKATNPLRNRTLENMQEILQMIFPSSMEHDRNR